MSTRALIGLFLALTAGTVIFLFVQMSGPSQRGLGPKSASACTGSDHCLPEIAWVDTDGNSYGKAQLEGKVVIVNFWATWCHPCEKEIPDLSNVATKYKDKVLILGVMADADVKAPDSNTLLNFMSDHNMSYPVIRKTDEIMRAFGSPEQYPTTYVYDRSGKERTRRLGAMTEAELSAIVERILHE